LAEEQEFEISEALIAGLDQLATAQPAVGAKLAEFQRSTPEFPPASFQTFVTKGYKQNAPLRSCLDTRGRTFAEGRLRVIDEKGREVKNHPVVDLVATPTDAKSLSERWKMTLLDLDLAGNAFWEKVRGVATREVVEIWRLDPSRVRIEPDPVQRIKRYLYDVGGKWEPIPKEDVIHWRYVDPDPLTRGFFGSPPLQSALRSMTADNELIDQMTLTLENRGIPAVILETDDPDLTKENAEEIRRRWAQLYGRRRQGGTAVTPKGTKAHVIGMKWNEMAIDQAIMIPESRICMVYGHPALLLRGTGGGGGLPGSGGSRIREAKEMLWTDVILPTQGSVAEQLTTSLVSEFDSTGRLRADFDTSNVPVLQEARLRRGEKSAKIFVDGLVSRHVAQRMGSIEQHGADVFADGTEDGRGTIETGAQGDE
jgi:HK97 family phage portal protein